MQIEHLRFSELLLSPHSPSLASRLQFETWVGTSDLRIEAKFDVNPWRRKTCEHLQIKQGIEWQSWYPPIWLFRDQSDASIGGLVGAALEPISSQQLTVDGHYSISSYYQGDTLFLTINIIINQYPHNQWWRLFQPLRFSLRLHPFETCTVCCTYNRRWI